MTPSTMVSETNFLIKHMRKKGIAPGSAVVVCIGAAMTIAHNSAKDTTTALAALDEAEKTAKQMAMRLREGIMGATAAKETSPPAQT